MTKEVVVIKATWCGPCKAYTPVVEEAKAEIATKGYETRFVDADENPEFCQKHGIRGVPSTLIMSDGIVLSTLVGKRTKEEILGHLF